MADFQETLIFSNGKLHAVIDTVSRLPAFTTVHNSSQLVLHGAVLLVLPQSPN